ncbi:hypothetical protein MJO28_004734 [Puccinia striiformis f. sp. tritici]|uniref:Uncharacterized protein n=1 Tax=Puccinia striiformis f. sp. tritici TaxID=168172 RepID=A0ACC0EJH0_9BASI|nr:hypothetical protein MJO28_004734 [Puccinia striiformis f. sp. tritici]
MNPNLNNPSGIHHHHQPSHSVSQLQPSLHYPHLPAAHTHPSQLHLSHQSQQQQHHHHPDPAPIREVPDHQQQQRTNIEHYKSSANPAYDGYIGSTHDALIIFSGCFRGDFPMVSRRLHERERRSIRSGAVYVFDETRAGIKRWTDGRVWSPSRILNNFLVYREIDQKRPTATNNASGSSTNPPNPNAGTPPTASASAANTTHKHDGDKSKSNQLNSGSSPLSTQAQSSNPHYSRPHSINPTGQSRTETRNPSELTSLDPKPSIPKNENQDQAQSASGENQSTPAATHRPMNRERERSLVGSLTSTYKFRPDGLVKKTISIAGMHMISYYKLDDVVSGRLRAPTSHGHLLHMEIAGHLLNPGFYRAPPTWGMANGRFWIQEEGPEEPSQVLSTVSSVSNNSSSLHSGQRPAALPAPASGSTSSNPSQGIRTSHPSTRPNASERIPSAALSRPGSSASSTGSPSVASPTTSHSFPLLSASNLHNTATTPRSPVINTIGARPNFSRVHNNNNTPPASGSSHLGRSSTIGGASSGRYEPYSRAARSPPHSAASTNTSTLTDQQASVQYYSPNHTTGGLSGYSTHSFLSESHSTPLVGTDQQSTSNRNTRQDSSAHDGRNLESPGQVGYDESGTYRTTSSTSGGGESLYAQYTITDPANSSHRSSSVPPSSYGLPSINRVGASAQPSSPASSTGTRGIGDYPFSSSSSQPQINRLSSSTANHGGSYGGYLSPAVAEHAFRASGGGSGLPERENNSYGSSSHSVNSLANPSGQASPSSGTQSASFLYPATSTSPSSGYSFSNSARRGSAVGSFTSELGSSNNDPARGGTRVNSQNGSSASHWGQLGSPHVMKKEEGAGG